MSHFPILKSILSITRLLQTLHSLSDTRVWCVVCVGICFLALLLSSLLERELLLTLRYGGLVFLLAFADTDYWWAPHTLNWESVGASRVSFDCWPTFTYIINMSSDYLFVWHSHMHWNTVWTFIYYPLGPGNQRYKQRPDLPPWTPSALPVDPPPLRYHLFFVHVQLLDVLY